MKNNTLKISVIGMLTALTIVLTVILTIPVPATEGYVNFGDTVIFITGVFMGGVPAMIVGGIGSMIADLIVAPHWALFTLIIKGLEGLFCGLLIKAFGKMNSHIARILAMTVAALWMSLGYFTVEGFMYGWPAAVGGLPFNFLQGGVSVVAAYLLSVALSNIKSLKHIFERLK